MVMGVFTYVVDLSKNGCFNGVKVVKNELIWFSI